MRVTYLKKKMISKLLLPQSLKKIRDITLNGELMVFDSAISIVTLIFPGNGIELGNLTELIFNIEFGFEHLVIFMFLI